ncbi:MAG TPA: LytTR family DNA-binding domain-containing protein [Bryobacteraceae bacterium]|jgi:two-component system LytT family response regulator/two-component system response regulator LytT|nr:LytTR family DNA-binding domain-containing protein [Bryobacteraceae bacterium]
MSQGSTGQQGTAVISTLIADDEQLARDELVFLLKDFPEIEVVATAANGLEAFELIQELEPELVFLDVQMPGLDGLGVIAKLRSAGAPLPHFVLTTAYDQYAVDAFRLEALDYLLKPVEKERLAESVGRARRFIEEKQAQEKPLEAAPRSVVRSKLLVKTNNRNLIVDAQDLVYATIEDGMITVATAQFEGQSNYRTIEELQSNLDPELFWRVHRSFLVNINKIREVIPWFKSSFQLKMNDRKQTEIPVSRIQTRRLRTLLKI